MNLLGRKLNRQILYWEPFATSTPLKPIPIDTNAKHGICSVRPTAFVPDPTPKMLNSSEVFQSKRSVKSKIKTGAKNRSRVYFDVSSSSDDDECDSLVEKNRPVIKIDSENAEKINLVAVNDKCNIGIKVSKNSSSVIRKLSSTKWINQKSKNQGTQEIVTKKRSVTFTSDSENINLSANNDINLLANAKNLSSENIRSLSGNSPSKKEKKLTNKVKNKLPVVEVNNENKNKKNPQRLVKRKHSEKANSVFVKKRKQEETVVPENKPALKKSQKLANSSHQLFTDTTQEQLINSLCMTTPELEESTQNVDYSKIKQESTTGTVKNKELKLTKSNKCNLVENENNSQKHLRPQRTRQAPKNYWLINDKPAKDKLKRTKKIIKKKSETQCESIKSVGSYLTNHFLEPEKVTSITQTVPKREKIHGNQNDVIGSYIKEIIKLEAETETQNQINLNAKGNVVSLDIKTENISEFPVFLPLSEVSYKENESKHQFSQVCDMRNFTCGIFKLKPGSSFTWKKTQKSNYMGGVLIKGKMSMTIGNKKHNLQEGDMVVVPPLSKCQTKNIGASDFIFYFWCGKFKK